MRKKLLFLNLIISMLVQAKLHTGDTFQIWEGYHKLWGTGGFYPCPRQKWKTGGCGVRIFHDY